MRISTKGQVTIPQEIREQLALQPGVEVDFVVMGNTVRLVPTKETKKRGQSIVARLRGKGTVRMTTDEIMALTRGEG
jgi:antitoxin PrlF